MSSSMNWTLTFYFLYSLKTGVGTWKLGEKRWKQEGIVKVFMVVDKAWTKVRTKDGKSIVAFKRPFCNKIEILWLSVGVRRMIVKIFIEWRESAYLSLEMRICLAMKSWATQMTDLSALEIRLTVWAQLAQSWSFMLRNKKLNATEKK